MESGSYQWAGYCGIVHLSTCFWGYNTIEEVIGKINILEPVMKKVDPNMVQYFFAVKATIFNLTETVSNPTELSESVWPEMKTVLEVSLKQDDMMTLLINATCILSLANWYSDAETAIELATVAEKYVQGAPGTYLDPVFRFHQSIAFCQGYHLLDSDKQAQFLENLKTNIDQFNLWAGHCSYTYLHQALLLKAEMARIEGDRLMAMDLYDKAISSAGLNGFTQNEAIANELAARFYLNDGKKKFAEIYLIEAYRAYQLWGATGKIKKLEDQYPEILNISDESSLKSSDIIDSPTSLLTTSMKLDQESVMKASHIMSEEVVLNELLKKIINILIENAGATRGLLIFENKGQWQIEAEGYIDVENVIVLQALPVNESKKVPETIINYISRTTEQVVLSEAAKEGFLRKTTTLQIISQSLYLVCH